MNTVRSLIFVVFMYGLMALMAVVCAPSLLLPRAYARACLTVYLKAIMWALKAVCGVTFSFEHTERIPEGGALIASQHQSMFETLALWLVLKDPAIVLKRSLAYLPFFGWYAIKLKNIVVNRSDGAKALRKMLSDAGERAAEGRQIVIFPQGTRARPGAPIVLQPGVAGLYKAMNVPCAPVALNSGEHWPGKGFVRTPGHITVRFLEPIEPGLPKKEFMEILEARLTQGDERLRGAGAAGAAGSEHAALNKSARRA